MPLNIDATIHGQLGNIGDFLGSIAVVISPMFLVVQLRSGIKTTRAATLPERQRDMLELLGAGLDRAAIAVRLSYSS